jgi:hypothetical protein
VLIQNGDKIGIGTATPDSTLTVNGAAMATRFTVNTSGQRLSINNYRSPGTTGANIWIGSGGQSVSGSSGASGSLNVGIGNGALLSDSTGFFNLAIGNNSLRLNKIGNYNVALGGSALFNNDGDGNMGIGGLSLEKNTSGTYNTAIGYVAMQNNVTGSNNIGIGSSALVSSTSGSGNTCIGNQTLQLVTSGNDNIAIGRYAGTETAAAAYNTSSTENIYIGALSKTALSGRTREIVIGYAAVGNGDSTTTIGNSSVKATYIPAGKMYIGGTTSPGATLHINGSLSRNAPVTVTANYTVAQTVSWIICDGTATIALTLPAAASWTGREIMVKTIQPYTVTSASPNVVPIDGVAATNAILPATDGAWATLVSDGTNWIIMQRGN